MQVLSKIKHKNAMQKTPELTTLRVQFMISTSITPGAVLHEHREPHHDDGCIATTTHTTKRFF